MTPGAFAVAPLPCLSVMTRAPQPLLALAVAMTAALAGCGDLSQEDLLFRAAVPQKQAVAVVPPGTEDEVTDALSAPVSSRRQGLEEQCDGDLLCESRNLARGFNGLTFFLLDIVDLVSALPPTERSPGRRVWGPHFDADKGTTFRFEMVREADGETFSFCLHAVRGFVGRAPNVDCSVDLDSDSGLGVVLSGAFVPSGIAGDGARLGKGSMVLSVERMNDLGGEPRFARSMTFAFDQTGGASAIQLDVQGTTVGEVERDASYTFNRAATGEGTLTFDVFADLIEGDALFGRRSLEQVALRAAWDSTLQGRATGTVFGGDAGDEVYSIEQCWSSDFARVYDRAIDGAETGDIALCIDGALLPE